MAGRVSNHIVTEGLIRYYDIANNRSYVGSNTTVNDLSPQNVTMSLVNSPTYNPNDYLGSFVFDGVNEEFRIPYFPIGSSSFAASIWIQLYSNISGLPAIIGCGNIWQAFPSVVGWQITYGLQNRGLSFGVTVATGSTVINVRTQLFDLPDDVYSRPSNIFIHRNTSTQRFVTYFNGVKVQDAQLNNDATCETGSFTNRNFIGVPAAAGQGLSFGSVYNIKIYHDKNFTEQEILQNYNALKWRYGL